MALGPAAAAPAAWAGAEVPPPWATLYDEEEGSCFLRVALLEEPLEEEPFDEDPEFLAVPEDLVEDPLLPTLAGLPLLPLEEPELLEVDGLEMRRDSPEAERSDDFDEPLELTRAGLPPRLPEPVDVDGRRSVLALVPLLGTSPLDPELRIITRLPSRGWTEILVPAGRRLRVLLDRLILFRLFNESPRRATRETFGPFSWSRRMTVRARELWG
jgi:hypothetical protein